MRGARVILACRNKDLAEEARDKIIKQSKNTNVTVKILDLSSFKSVRNFAKDFNATENSLDILVNNAGVYWFGNDLTEDGLHVTMQVNHYSHFLLTILLLEKLKNSAPSRVVNVSSLGAKFSKMTLENMDQYWKGNFPDSIMYANSKLCNILFTRELAERLRGTGVNVYALHPGAIYTELSRNIFGVVRTIFKSITRLFFLVRLYRLFRQT